MTPTLPSATQTLYSTFAKYQRQPKIAGCPCCVSNTDRSKLHAKALRELEDEDLSKYAFKAMTTWGNVNDFKHYLPRIFELAATRKLGVDTFVILGKLNYGKWQVWEREEQEVLMSFIKAWWKFDINNALYFDAELLVDLHTIIQDLPAMLKNWDLSLRSQGLENYLDLIERHYFEIASKNRTFRKLGQQNTEVFIQWVRTKAPLIRTALSAQTSDEGGFAEWKVNTLYFLNWVE